MNQINETILIIVLILFGTIGNILYRLNNHLKIKPVYVRALIGFMAAVIYILFFFFILKEKPRFEPLKLVGCFAIGYFTELILDTMRDKIPGILNKFVPGGADNGNDK